MTFIRRSASASLLMLMVALISFFGAGISNSASIIPTTGKVLAAGGTGNPTALGTQHQIAAAFSSGSQRVALHTPEEFWPVTGTKTYDASRNEGTDIMVTAVRNANGKVTLQGYSQSAASAEQAAKRLQAQGLGNKVSLSVMGSPERNGPTKGIGAVFAGTGIPGFISFDKNPSSFTGNRTDICRQYDAICDFPPDMDPVKIANAVAGYFYVHPFYGVRDVNMKTAKITKMGNTTYVDIPTATPPIITAVRALGVPVSKDIEKQVKQYIDTSNWAPKIPAMGGAPKATPAVKNIPAPAANPTQAYIDNGVKAAENWANTQPAPVKAAVQAVTKVIAPKQTQSYTAPAQNNTPAPAYSAPVKQFASDINNAVKQVAPQAAPAVNKAVSDIAGAFGVHLN